MDKVYCLQSDKGKSFHKMVLGQLYAQMEKSISHHYPKSVSNGSWSLNKNSNKTICRIDYTKISFWTIVICNKMCMFHKQNGERVYPIITLLLICFVIIPLGMWLWNSLSQSMKIFQNPHPGKFPLSVTGDLPKGRTCSVMNITFPEWVCSVYHFYIIM